MLNFKKNILKKQQFFLNIFPQYTGLCIVYIMYMYDYHYITINLGKEELDHLIAMGCD